MSRFFYTDPLAAAWMAKHFGMRFQLFPTPQEEESDGVSEPFELPYYADFRNDNRIVEWLIDLRSFNRLAYLHLDSLPLLEPQVGDLVVLVSDGRAMPVDSSELAEYIKRRGTAWRIIQRNGLAFHQPEREAA